jgi:ABC-type phosphate transport system substrate-binding protein
MRPWLTVLLMCLACQVSADWLVVVGTDSPIDSLSEKQVADIFLSRTRYIEPVGYVTPLEIDNEADRYDFYHRISNKTPSQVNSYWTAMIFTGKGRPPKTVSNRQQLLEELRHDPGAISFVDDSQLSPELKVVYRFE